MKCSVSLIDPALIMDLGPINDYEDFQTIESCCDPSGSSLEYTDNSQQSVHNNSCLSTDNRPVAELPNTVYSKYGLVASTVHEVPVTTINDLNDANVVFNEVEYIGENEEIDASIDNDTTLHTEEPSKSALSNIPVTFEELSGRDKIFRSHVDTGFDMLDFGISDHLTLQSPQSQSKRSKLVQKIRRDVRELGLLCAATDKKKLVNVLIINQQLNAIDSPDMSSDVSTESSSEPRTIKTILAPPIMPQRAKPKTHRNIKVGYGVATADEVLEHIAEREILDGQLEIEQEENEIEKKGREKRMEDVEKQLQETRKILMKLRSENASNVKEAAQQKKSKKRVGNRNIGDTILQNKTKIESKNAELKDLRELLKSLKSEHILANKAAATKRRNDLQQKKEKGNVVIPQAQSEN